MEPVLLYSGGKDSLMTLKHLVDSGYDPTILHFHTKKISDYYERLIKKNAMRIHRTPYYYVIKTDTENYNASTEPKTGLYVVSINENQESDVYPHEYGEPVYFGYSCTDHKSIQKAIKFLHYHRPERYKFPFKDMEEDKIIEKWEELPLKIRQDTISSTIMNFEEWGGKVVGKEEV